MDRDGNLLKPSDLVCIFIFEPFSHEKARRKRLRSPSSESVIILEEASENSGYVASYDIVESPRIRQFPVLQFEEFATEYRVFHCP